MNEQNKKVPTVRFKGFTNDWEQRKGKSIFYSKSNKDFPELTVLSATQDKGMIPRSSTGIDIKYEKKSLRGYKKIEPGDFVVHLRSFQGGFAYSDLTGIVSPAYTVFTFKQPEMFNNYFWKEKFTSYNFIQLLKKVTYGVRDGRSISYSDFLTLNEKFPVKVEQTKIADLFKIIDNLIALQQRKLDLLKQLKKGLLQKMFADKDSKRPVLQFKIFHDDWEQRKLGDLFVYNRPDKYMVQDTNYINSGTPVLTANKSFVLGYTNENHTYNKLPAIIFDDFTLENKFVNFPFMVKSSAIKILNSRNDQPMMFMYQLLQHSRFVHEGHSRHYISIVQRKDVMVPDNVEEQKKIATLFSRIQNIIAFQHQKLAKYQSVKKSLLQQMFI